VHSSISNSEPPFFPRALLLLAATATLVVLVAQVAGAHSPRPPLVPPHLETATAPRRLIAFGNSYIAAAISPAALTQALAARGLQVTLHQLTGGGWNALHYVVLARLVEDTLRPRRDVVLLDVSPHALDDAEPDAHLDVIPPASAWTVATLPSAPTEVRLDLLLDALAPLYRHRLLWQARAWTRLGARATAAVACAALPAALVRPPATAPPFMLVTDPQLDFVVREIRGDRAAFREQNRRWLRDWMAHARFGGYKREALEQAIAGLSERGIQIVLLATPRSRWFDEEFEKTTAGQSYQATVASLARRAGGRLLDRWDARFGDEDATWDDYHLTPTTSAAFDEAVAEALAGMPGLRW
jgi:hypothetical protein